MGGMALLLLLSGGARRPTAPQPLAGILLRLSAGTKVKIFGRYIAPPFLWLAALDAGIFYLMLRALSLGRHCHGCYFGTVVTLNTFEIVLLTGAFLLITTSVGLYNRDALLDFRVFMKRFIIGWQLIFIPTVIFVAISKFVDGLPFGWFIGILSLAIALFMLVLLTVRLLLVSLFRMPFTKKRVLVLGDGAAANETMKFIQGPGRSHLQLVQSITSWPAEAISTQDGNLALQSTEPAVALSLLARAQRVDEIIVAVDDKRGLPLWQLLECKLKGINVVEYLTFWEREAFQIDSATAGPGWLIFAEGFLINQQRRALKQLVDFTVSLAFLIVTLPVTLFTALAIKLESKGPIFYRQERVGLNNEVFKIWKFRSMRTDAECDGVPRWAASADARITRVGRFIRLTRIDEIPQILNVLAGHMSFIGPRPERPFFVDQLAKEIPYYALRHRVKPGITGWAQVNYPYGASIEDAKCKLAYDLYYVKNNDVFLDFAILMQTVRVILFPSGVR